MKRLALAIALVLQFCFLSLNTSAAAPSTTELLKVIQINGFDVYLINTHKGNGVALTTAVQLGSLHDEPQKHAGRAHLWEHVIHAGSKKHPGHQTFWNQIKKIGADYNAYTSSNRIFYHFYMYHEGLEEAADLLGAMISEPEWNPESYRKELETVKNEALEYQGNEIRALNAMIDLHTLPKNHPFAMYPIGSQQQLNAMSIDDLKDLYYSNYTPENMQIIIAGNFDNPDVISEERVQKIIGEKFFPANIKNDPQGYHKTTPTLSKKEIPHFVTKDTSKLPPSRFIEVQTQNNKRIFKLKTEMNSNFFYQNTDTLEMLIDILNMKGPGSLDEQLKNESLITSFAISIEHVNNRVWLNPTFILTEKGASERYGRVMEIFWAAIKQLQTHLPSTDMMTYLKQININSYQHISESPDHAAEKVSEKILFFKNPYSILNFKERFNKITPEKIQEAAQKSFYLDQTIGGYMGPDVQADNIDPLFKLSYRTINESLTIKKWKKVLTSVEGKYQVKVPKPFVKFSQEQRNPNPQKAPYFYKQGVANQVVIQESSTPLTGAMSINLSLPFLSIKEQLSLKLLFTAFKQHYSEKFNLLFSQSIHTELYPSPSSIIINIEGNALAIMDTYSWLLQNLKTFQASPEELKQAKNIFAHQYQSSLTEFSASIANDRSFTLLTDATATSDQLYQKLKSTKLTDINSVFQRVTRKIDLKAALYGDILPSDADKVITTARKLFPQPLPASTRKKRKNRFLTIKNQTRSWTSIGDSKEDMSYGLSRSYNGPQALTREHAAAIILASELDGKVFARNRIQQDLGYVHGAGLRTYPSGTYFRFTGQTTGDKKLPLISTGWHELIMDIINNKLSNDDFKNTRLGLLRQEQLLPTDLSELTSLLYNDAFTFNEIGAKEKLNRLIADVTVEEIYAVGKKYLTANNFFEVLASKEAPKANDCNLFLSVPQKIRNNIKGN